MTCMYNNYILGKKYQTGDISFEDHEKEKARIEKSVVVLRQVSTRMSLTLGQIIRSIDFKKLEVSNLAR